MPTHQSPLSMQSVLLLGDSITQQGYHSGWVSHVSDALVRRAYVVNSGLSGYNTRWVLDILKDPTRSAGLIPDWVREPLFVTLMLGSNDCAEGGQHVPLSEYQANLKEIIDIVVDNIKPHGGIFVLTPPPVNEDAWNAKNTNDRRFYAGARAYRQAALEAVQESTAAHPQQVRAVDMQKAFLQYNAPDATDVDMDYFHADGAWTSLLLPDGLHINGEGGRLFSDTLLAAVRASPHGAKLLRNNDRLWPVPHWASMMREFDARKK